jgi:hypothetical protein
MVKWSFKVEVNRLTKTEGENNEERTEPWPVWPLGSRNVIYRERRNGLTAPANLLAE